MQFRFKLYYYLILRKILTLNKQAIISKKMHETGIIYENLSFDQH